MREQKLETARRKALRRDVVEELEALDLMGDMDSHGRLSAIARTIYDPMWGWTEGACEALRFALIDMLTDDDEDARQSAPDGECGPIGTDVGQVPKRGASDGHVRARESAAREALSLMAEASEVLRLTAEVLDGVAREV